MSKKRSEWRFVRNLRKYQTDFKSNDVKMRVLVAVPTQAISYVHATFPKGGARRKKFQKCDFCVTEGPRSNEFGMVVIRYK